MKTEEIDTLTQKKWIIKFVDMPLKQLTAEVIRRQGGQWYQLASGGYILCKDLGEYTVPGCHKTDWPEFFPDEYILDTDSYPDYAKNANEIMRLCLEYRNDNGDPYRLNLETDENNRKRWLAIFRKYHAYAWGDSPAEALCRAYLLEYEISTDRDWERVMTR
jgi:hypothetical protein